MVGNYNLSQSTHSQNCFSQGCGGGPGFQGGASGKEPTCQCRRHKRCGLDPRVRKEEGMAAHSSILAWRIPWTEEPAGYSPWAHKELKMIEYKHLISSPEYSARDDARKIQGRGCHLRPKKCFY